MPATFDEATRGLLDGKNFVTVATLGPDGSPHTSVVWFERDGDTVLFSTTSGRRKARNHTSTWARTRRWNPTTSCA
jgi:Pyridoxamine 5'-phosphate oxidase